MTIHQHPARTARRVTSRSRRNASAAFVVALLAVTLSACAPDADPGVASAGDGKGSNTGQADAKTSYEDMTDAERQDLDRQFASCMRDNGVDMPDPGTDGGLSVSSGAGDAEEAENMQKAFETCKEFTPNGGEPVKMSPEDLEASREFAKCMRENGVDMPDPDPNGGMTGALEIPEDMAVFDAALEACNASGGMAVPMMDSAQ